ncbi:MAG: glycoside hydrolase family 70 protein, partial [Bacillota bacterium]|nr:glycoside hydrolase family 70 protein [Bacillota bacterium]
MKKGIAILASATLLVGLSGCAGDSKKNAGNGRDNYGPLNVSYKNNADNLHPLNVGNPIQTIRTNSPKGFASNPELDKHVIFQSFSLYQPYESNMYINLMKNSALVKRWGISDVWMPPAYRAFSQSYYGEGYAIADRYDLGEFPQGLNGAKATKYGTSDQLKQLIKNLHANGLHAQEDLVPNQMMGLPTPEVTSITSVDVYGNENDPNVKDKLAVIYSKGGGPGQAKYGLIKEWNQLYYNGTGPQQLGMYRVMVDNNMKPYRYYGPNDSKNYLPDWLNNSDAQKYGKINT